MSTLLIFWALTTMVSSSTQEAAIVADCAQYAEVTGHATKYVGKTCYIQRDGVWLDRYGR